MNILKMQLERAVTIFYLIKTKYQGLRGKSPPGSKQDGCSTDSRDSSICFRHTPKQRTTKDFCFHGTHVGHAIQKSSTVISSRKGQNKAP